MSESKTPRTKAASEQAHVFMPYVSVIEEHVCAEIESDLAVALAERDAAKAELKSLLEEPFFREHQHALHRAMVAEAERDALAARVEKSEADATRYKEWRQAFREGECGLWNALCECQTDEEHDAAIDAAIAKERTS